MEGLTKRRFGRPSYREGQMLNTALITPPPARHRRNQLGGRVVPATMNVRWLPALGLLCLIAACGGSASSAGTTPTSSGRGTSSPVSSATPAGTPGSPATPRPLGSAPAPAGFIIGDMSFAGGRAFAIGTAPGRGGATLVASDDSGATWHLVGNVPLEARRHASSPPPGTCASVAPRPGTPGIGPISSSLTMAGRPGTCSLPSTRRCPKSTSSTSQRTATGQCGR